MPVIIDNFAIKKTSTLPPRFRVVLLKLIDELSKSPVTITLSWISKATDIPCSQEVPPALFAHRTLPELSYLTIIISLVLFPALCKVILPAMTDLPYSLYFQSCS